MTIKTCLAPDVSIWTVYDWILKLKNEAYIVRIGGGDWYLPDVWSLSKKGFLVCIDDLGEMSEKRFKPHSVPHDAWVLAFHLGDFINGVPEYARICSEQQFRSFDHSLQPGWLPEDKTHVPDGFTRIKNGEETTVYGIEVELNAKPIERYTEIFNYYDDAISISQVLWLAGSEYVKKRMLEKLWLMDLTRKEIHNFISFEDFKINGWKAVINHGYLKDSSVQSLMFPTSVLQQSYISPTPVLPSAIEVFLNTGRSPRKLAR
jgi:hypothetical protein